MVDIGFTDEGMLVCIRRSKTDQEAIGREVAIPHGAHPMTPKGITADAVCRRASVVPGRSVCPITRGGGPRTAWPRSA